MESHGVDDWRREYLLKIELQILPQQNAEDSVYSSKQILFHV